MRQVDYYQSILNENKNGYDELYTEEDPYILTALIWSWLDHLKEPILREQEINILLKNFPTKSIGSSFRMQDFEENIINWKELDKVI